MITHHSRGSTTPGLVAPGCFRLGVGSQDSNHSPAYLSQRESPALSVSDECSDALSEPRGEQGGREARTLRATNKKLKPVGAGNYSSYSGKVGVVWRSPVIKNASLPESDFAVRRSQADGTARTGQADTQVHHSRTGLTACVQTRVPARGILPPLVSACPAPSAWKPRRRRATPDCLRDVVPLRLRRGGCHDWRWSNLSS
jgi:hypothetical protein